MKKSRLFLSAVFALCVQIVSAQTFGIKGGVNFANFHLSPGGMPYYSTLIGFHIGPVAEFKLKGSLFFNTGLLFSMTGSMGSRENFDDFFTTTGGINSLEIPLNLGYKFLLNEKSRLFIQAGPYLAYGLNGTKEISWSGLFDFWYARLKKFDYGVGLGAGVEFGKLTAGVNYQLGLANLNESTSSGFNTSDIKVKTRVLQISLAYMFGKK